VVMDEADRMVHLGFEADLTFILDALPSEILKGENSMDVDGAINTKARTRVTTLFSATMPPAVERLAKKYLKKAAVITIGEAGRAVDTVEQRVEFVPGEEKKKCVVPVLFTFVLMSGFLGNGLWKFSILAHFPHPSSSSSTKRRQPIWSPRTCSVHTCVNSSDLNSSDVPPVFFLVERIHTTFWKVTRATRGCFGSA